MTQRESLLRAVLDNPDDNFVRLVYADFLEESGDVARAEFIRVQVELAKKGITSVNLGVMGPGIFWNDGSVGQGEIEKLLERERELLNTNEVIGWVGGVLLSIAANEGCWYSWKRGFIEELTLSSADWSQHHEAILAEHPIKKVTLTTYPTVNEFGDLIYYDIWKLGPTLWLKELWPRIEFELPEPFEIPQIWFSAQLSEPRPFIHMDDPTS